MVEHNTSEHSILKIGDQLHKLTPIVDKAGGVIHHVVTPLMVEIKARDMLQIIVGAALLAIPVSFTEEVWNLGDQLPSSRVALLGMLSFLLVALFVYCNYYQGHLRQHVLLYVYRICVTYAAALFVAAVLLTLVDRCPWGIDNVLAIKRIIIVAFPGSMSAALSDSIR